MLISKNLELTLLLRQIRKCKGFAQGKHWPQSTIATIKSKKKKLRKSWVDALIVLELDAEDKAVVCAVNPFVVRFIEFMVAIKRRARNIQSDAVAPNVEALVAFVCVIAIPLRSNDGRPLADICWDAPGLVRSRPAVAAAFAPDF